MNRRQFLGASLGAAAPPVGTASAFVPSPEMPPPGEYWVGLAFNGPQGGLTACVAKHVSDPSALRAPEALLIEKPNFCYPSCWYGDPPLSSPGVKLWAPEWWRNGGGY